MAAGPGAASAPGHRAEGAPPRVLRYPRALPAPPRCPCYGVPGALWGQRCEGAPGEPQAGAGSAGRGGSERGRSGRFALFLEIKRSRIWLSQRSLVEEAPQLL